MRTHFNSRELNIEFFSDPDYYTASDDLFDSDGDFIEYEELESRVCASPEMIGVDEDDFDMYID